MTNSAAPKDSAPLRELHGEFEQKSGDLGLAHDELAALLQISQALSQHRDRQALFAAIAEAIEGRLPADRLIVLIPGSQGDAVTVYAVHGAAKLSEGERIPTDRCQPG